MANAKDFVVNILGDSSGVDKVFSAFKDNAGKAAAAAAAAFAGQQIGNALAANVDADRVNRELNASLGATPAQAESWGAAAGALYRDAYGESLEEVSGAVESVVSSIGGMREASQADLEEVTAAAMNVAQAFELDVGEAATTAGLMVQNGLADNAMQAFDLMTASLQQVPEALRGDVMDATNEYAQYFSQLGLDGEQSMGLLVAASANGQYAIDKTGDALKELTIRGTDMSTASVAAYGAAGLSASDMATKLQAGGDQGAEALGQIATGLLGITDPQAQANAAIALFGTPLEDIGTDKIPAFLESLGAAQTGLGDTAGAAQAMGDTLNGSPAASAESWRRNMQGWVQDLTNLPGPLGDVALGVQAFGGDALNVAGSVGMAVTAFRGMNGETIKNTVSTIANTAAAVGSKVALVAGTVATGVATAAQWAWNAAMSANPIGLVVLAIAALIAGIILLVKNWDSVKAAGAAAWDWIKGAWSGAGDFFSGLGDKIKGAFKGAFNSVAGWWNNSVGKLSWTTPSWIPGIGGKTLSVPKIPMLAEGGTVDTAGMAWVGEAGPELLRLPVGASVTPLNGRATAGAGNPSASGGGRGARDRGVRDVTVNMSGSASPRQIAEELDWLGRR
jgi:phage-related minor tail protein